MAVGSEGGINGAAGPSEASEAADATRGARAKAKTKADAIKAADTAAKAKSDAIKAAGNLQSHLSSNVNNIAQRAALAALTGPQDEAEQMRLAFDHRRGLIVSELAKIPGVTVPNPLGAFYVYPDVTGLLGREWDGVRIDTSLELADFILERAEVAVVPGEAFGPSGYLRLSYALGEDQLLEGVQRLQRLFG